MKLERQLREAIRTRHFSLKTEQNYVGWYKRYLYFQKERLGEMTHPDQMGAEDVTAFLTHLAVNRSVSASTQNQALNALVFLYREVLGIKLDGIDAKRAKVSRRLPVVLTREEMAALLKEVRGEAGLSIELLYGCGLRVSEVLALRIKDVDISGRKLEIRAAKGDKDRVLTLPMTLTAALEAQRKRARELHDEDRERSRPGVMLPTALERKNPGAATSWEWFWFFPSRSESTDPRSGIVRRHHLHEAGIARELARASKLAGIEKRVTAHVMRHSFATHLILRGVDVRSVQQLLGHSHVRTTEVYTQLARSMRGEITSPLDDLF